ncbi:hypothetical protein N7478_000815 [Penicillium angulare]|uniref:uncharacterized protein n=1 Tax=Penicillium angulare TaxID=116970 RepID=UPI0025408B6E|nr:uncharacterized protein N7478_000815 [Penicillium angulare]KAJ5291564.1 hypothetical protein N7478_000815 [Penicillium angulare]
MFNSQFREAQQLMLNLEEIEQSEARNSGVGNDNQLVYQRDSGYQPQCQGGLSTKSSRFSEKELANNKSHRLYGAQKRDRDTLNEISTLMNGSNVEGLRLDGSKDMVLTPIPSI